MKIILVALLAICLYNFLYSRNTPTPDTLLAVCAFRTCSSGMLINHCWSNRDKICEFDASAPSNRRKSALKCKLSDHVYKMRISCYHRCKKSTASPRNEEEAHNASLDMVRFDLMDFDNVFRQAEDMVNDKGAAD